MERASFIIFPNLLIPSFKYGLSRSENPSFRNFRSLYFRKYTLALKFHIFIADLNIPCKIYWQRQCLPNWKKIIKHIAKLSLIKAFPSQNPHLNCQNLTCRISELPQNLFCTLAKSTEYYWSKCISNNIIL